MKTPIRIFVIIAISSLPVALFAQTNTFSAVKPFGVVLKLRIDTLPLHTFSKNNQLPFGYHLPLTTPHKSKVLVSDPSQGDPAYHYNMPVIKPGQTSRILIAKMDSEFPYSYKMPIKKLD